MCQTCGNLHFHTLLLESAPMRRAGAKLLQCRSVGRSVTHQRNSAALRGLNGGL